MRSCAAQKQLSGLTQGLQALAIIPLTFWRQSRVLFTSVRLERQVMTHLLSKVTLFNAGRTRVRTCLRIAPCMQGAHTWLFSPHLSHSGNDVPRRLRPCARKRNLP